MCGVCDDMKYSGARHKEMGLINSHTFVLLFASIFAISIQNIIVVQPLYEYMNNVAVISRSDSLALILINLILVILEITTLLAYTDRIKRKRE